GRGHSPPSLDMCDGEDDDKDQPEDRHQPRGTDPAEPFVPGEATESDQTQPDRPPGDQVEKQGHAEQATHCRRDQPAEDSEGDDPGAGYGGAAVPRPFSDHSS